MHPFGARLSRGAAALRQTQPGHFRGLKWMQAPPLPTRTLALGLITPPKFSGEVPALRAPTWASLEIRSSDVMTEEEAMAEASGLNLLGQCPYKRGIWTQTLLLCKLVSPCHLPSHVQARKEARNPRCSPRTWRPCPARA